MANLMDYLDWRGDLPFAADGFNEVDNLILAQLAYVDFEGIVEGPGAGGGISLKDASRLFWERHTEEEILSKVSMTKSAPFVMRKMAGTKRYADVMLSNYVNDVSDEEQSQFSVVCAALPGEGTYVAFSGTDDTIVGWRENFNMGFLAETPGQLKAVDYLNRVAPDVLAQGAGGSPAGDIGGASRQPGIRDRAVTYSAGEGSQAQGAGGSPAGDIGGASRQPGIQDRAVTYSAGEGILRVGGHSKGGNLSVYASVKCEPWIQDRIVQVYSNDGPGFPKTMLESAEYRGMLPKIRTILPESSVVGLILEHQGACEVVKSSQSGIQQHDAMSWEVLGNSFVYAKNVAAGSILLDETMKAWIGQLDGEEREQIVDAVFSMLEAADIKTVDDFYRSKWKRLQELMKATGRLPEETQRLFSKALKLLWSEGNRALKKAVRENNSKKNIKLKKMEENIKKGENKRNKEDLP